MTTPMVFETMLTIGMTEKKWRELCEKADKYDRIVKAFNETLGIEED